MGATVSEHVDPMGESGAELYRKPFMVLEVDGDEYGSYWGGQSKGKMRCRRTAPESKRQRVGY